MASPHEILDVDPGADEQTVRDAYRERVKEAHPDQGGTVEEFQRVRSAYEAIVDGDGGGEEIVDEVRRNGTEPPEPEPDEPDRATVEYLNYAVLDDYGWSVDDPDLFERAAAAGLGAADYGEFEAEFDESLLEAAERHEHAWPFACRGGACANCAVLVVEGDLSMRVDHVLPQEMVEEGFSLSCNGEPTTDEVRVLYNVKHLPDLEDLLLPPRPFEQAHGD
ncbi:ferredoxin Fer [Halomicrobium salinisoli]|uniref:ferredoxin Fer n=1 Tax=Halomicrobium salinisoli TaxID=2878391 RepID=UPI001CF013FD|nr:ferredoxin Fer [Halomicrobium salinisoli]